MKFFHSFLFLVLAASQVARADDLQDAAKAFSNKSYSEALRLYNKAALAGNAEAQFHLGEMYWYGEGVATDEAAASSWFQKSSAAGNPKAAEALGVTKSRQARRADIDYWYTKYDGADLKSGQFDCRAPAIPEGSDSNADITRVSQEFSAWRDCYNGFVNNLNDALPPGKRIPSDIEVLMNEQEIAQARKHMDAVYQRVSATQADSAKLATERYAAWQANTERMVAKANAAAEQRRKADEVALARSRDYQRTDGSNPIGPKGATVGAGR